MKKMKDPFETNSWHYDVITDPRQVFTESYAWGNPAYFGKFISSVIRHARLDKLFNKKSPADVLLNMRIIRSVIKAAYSLGKTKASIIKVAPEDYLKDEYFRSHYIDSDFWTDFPRHLTPKEYCNPYKVFHRFFAYQSAEAWVACWEELVEMALSESSGETDCDIIRITTLLQKLMDAAHLINVREVTHVGGHLKR